MARRFKYPQMMRERALELVRSGVLSREEIGKIICPDAPVPEGTIRHWEKLEADRTRNEGVN